MLQPVLPSRWVLTTPDAADDPDLFPYLIGQSFLLLKTPLWSTKVDTAVSGVERRRRLWSYPVWKFRLSHDVLRDGPAFLELQQMVTFFNMKAGMCQGFFYLDRFDNAVTDCQFGIGDGVTTSFQAMRTTTIGGITFSEPVRGFNGTPVVSVNGTATAAFTVGELGQIVFTSAPAAGAVLTWTGSFLYLVRFDKDELDLNQIGSGLWASGQFDFRSFKV